MNNSCESTDFKDISLFLFMYSDDSVVLYSKCLTICTITEKNGT